MKKQKNIRLSAKSVEKLAVLGHQYGTETTALEIAIDRMYRNEARKMQLIIVDGVIKQGAYYGEGSSDVWEGDPATLPLSVIQEWMDGLEEDYPEVGNPKEIWAALKRGDDCTAAQESTDLLGEYAVLEFQWRED